jgi:hypothetical protein
VDLAEALRRYLSQSPQTPLSGDYGAPLRPMVDPLAGRRSVGEMSTTQHLVGEVGKGLAEPFGKLGRVMTGQSQDRLSDLVGAAAGLAPIGPPGVGRVAGRVLKAGGEALESAIGRASAKGARALAGNAGGVEDKIRETQ